MATPWHIEGDNPACKGWAVVKTQDGKVVGCHPTREKALKQQAALYVKEGSMTTTAEDISRAVDNSPWDGNAAMSAAKTAADYRAICAAKTSGDTSLRSTWKLPHHKSPGAPPNAAGVRNALARLSQTEGIDQAAARSHLEAHMREINPQRDLPEPPADIMRSMAMDVVESDGDGSIATLSGNLAVFKEWAKIDSVFEGRFMEQVLPGSFKTTIERDAARYRVLLEHGRHPQLGRLPLGPIKVLREEEHGAYYEVALLDTAFNRDLLPGLKAGLYGSSFQGKVERELFDPWAREAPHNPEGLAERSIVEMSLKDFGPTPFPAYVGAGASARSTTDEFIFRHLEGGEGLQKFAEWAAQQKSRPPEVRVEQLEETMKEPAVKPPEDQRPAERKEAAVAVDLSKYDSRELLASRRDEVQQRVEYLGTEYTGRAFPGDVESEFESLTEERDAIVALLADLDKRDAQIARHAQNGGEAGTEDREKVRKDVQVKRDRRLPDNIYDLSAYRQIARSVEDERALYRDGAMKALEQNRLAFERAKPEVVKDHVSGLLDREDRSTGYLAQRMLATGSPQYSRAFWKHAAGQQLSNEEQRALAYAQDIERAFTLGTTGMPVPYVLDPTLIPTSNGTVNPWRAICRIETITGANEWRGTTSGAITAAYAAEATEASDNTPALVQPVIPAVRAQAFVPFSIEVQADWGALEAEMATLLGDAKDDLEAGSTGFFGGNGTNQPTGLNALPVAADTLTAAVATFAVGDLFLLENALAPRFRARASMVGNRQQFGRVRQFSIGDNIWVPLTQGLANQVPTPGRLGQDLLGYPTYESSQMVTTVTAGSRILLLGDFRYYVIVDRVGMNIEVIPHLFGAASRFPTGQRGLYAIWRNGGEPVDTTNGAGFKFLKSRQT